MKKQLIVLSALFVISASQCSLYDKMKAKANAMKESAQSALSSMKGKLANVKENIGSAWGDVKYKGKALMNKILPPKAIVGHETSSDGRLVILYTMQGEPYHHITNISISPLDPEYDRVVDEAKREFARIHDLKLQ